MKKYKPSKETNDLIAQESAAVYEYVRISRSGLPKDFAYMVSEALRLTISEFAGFLHITVRTLQRKSASEVLTVPVSEHLIHLYNLLKRGESVFGSREVFQNWLQSPVPALGNQAPRSLLDTNFGIRIVNDELNRLQYGVYS